jgi:hypothetical protein
VEHDAGKHSKTIGLLGGCAVFWHNDTDHSIVFGVEMVGELLGQDGEFDFGNYFDN